MTSVVEERHKEQTALTLEKTKENTTLKEENPELREQKKGYKAVDTILHLSEFISKAQRDSEDEGTARKRKRSAAS